MRKKILAVLAPVLAIMAFAVVPAIAQAEEIQGTTFTASSGNLETETGLGRLHCAESELELEKISATQALVVGGHFRQSPTNLHCPIVGSSPALTAIIQTNASEVGWFFHTGPGGAGSLQPGGGEIDFTAHIYLAANQQLVAQCQYSTPSVPLDYTPGVANPTIEAQPTVFTGSEGCGNGTLEGTFETAGVTID